MKILSPKEFIKERNNHDLECYVDYLERVQAETEQVLKNAKELSLSEAVLEEIQEQSSEIVKMLDMIQRDMQEILFKSIDELPLEELQTYFDFSKEQEVREKEYSHKQAVSLKLQEQLKEVEQRIHDNLYENGRDASFYQVEDSLTFFQEEISPKKCIDKILSSSTKVGNVWHFEKNLHYALSLEMRSQHCIEVPEQLEEMTRKIIELLEKCQKVCVYSNEAKEQLVETILSKNGLGEILEGNFEQNPYQHMISDFIHLKKRNTQFFKQLPNGLKDKLLLEKFQGPIYQKLLETYQAFSQGKEPDNTDINKQEVKYKREIETDLKNNMMEMDQLIMEKGAQGKFLSDENAMRSTIKQEVQHFIVDKQTSIEEMGQVISGIYENKQKVKLDLESLRDAFVSKTENLRKAQEIMKNPSYGSFFQAVEKKNMLLFYRVLGCQHTKEELLPYLEAEKRRLSQITMILSSQNKMDEIYQTIQEMKRKSNFLTRWRKSYKERFNRLNEEYRKIEMDCIHELELHNLVHVYAPGKEVDGYTAFDSFTRLKLLTQTFWDLSKGIGEKTRYQFLRKAGVQDWEGYRKDLVEKQESLVQKLFCCEENVDGYYQFAICAEERIPLLETQKTIVDIIESAYKERKAFGEFLEKDGEPLDEEKVQALESLLGKGNNISKESLAIFIVKTQAEIEELQREMICNKTISADLGVRLPIEETESSENLVMEKEVDFDQKIKDLQINGVSTLKDAVQYQEVFSGLDEYRVTPTYIKNSYEKKKILI